MSRVLRLSPVLLIVALATCKDREDHGPSRPVTELSTEAQVSNLMALPSGSLLRAGPGMPNAEAGTDGIVYVSLPEGAVPGGISAAVRRVGDEASIVTPMQDGGFDPVVVRAALGDTVEIVVTKAGGTTATMKAPVKGRRPPTVVRSYPPRSKRDVPVNASLVVVFSEPLDRRTVSPTQVQLFVGRDQVPGTVLVLEGDGTAVAFTAHAKLDPLEEYRLVLSGSIADLDGDEMGVDVVVGFTTGTTVVGPPASIVVSPDSIILLSKNTYQFSAKVFDAADNLLQAKVVWHSTELTLLNVSATGLATALEARFVDDANWGEAGLEARIGTLAGSAFVAVVPQPGSVQVQPSAATIGVGDTLALRIVVRGGGFNDRIFPPLTINNSNPAAGSLSQPDTGALLVVPTRTVTALAPGLLRITVKAGAVSGSADVTVTDQPPVHSVTVAPAAAELAVGETLQLATWLRAASGAYISQPRAVSWTSSDPAVVSVSAAGKVTAAGNGTATIVAASEGKSDSATITVSAQPPPLTFLELRSNHSATCGVSSTGDTYCWGYPYDDAGGPRELRMPALLPGGLNLAAMRPSQSAGYSCGRTGAGEAFCWNYFSSAPHPFAPALRFVDLATSMYGHGCGVATNGITYCWGNNSHGQLGDGTQTTRATPTPVAGGVAFASVVVDLYHSCGLAVSGDAYCWGANFDPGTGAPDRARGLLGTGDSTTVDILVPRRVVGGLAFAQLSVGFYHTCGITTEGRAYCWGKNASGQLGDGTQTDRREPTAVDTPLRFTAIDAHSVGHTCAIATDGAAYCWGSNFAGALGVNTAPDCCALCNGCSLRPIAVQGGLRFIRIALGAAHSCAIAVSGRAYCWGYNQFGRLGDGTNVSRSAPTPVSRPHPGAMTP